MLNSANVIFFFCKLNILRKVILFAMASLFVLIGNYPPNLHRDMSLSATIYP